MSTSSVMMDIFKELGKKNALDLRSSANELSETEIINREHAVPRFDPTKDYSSWPIGSPVSDSDQVWLLIQPHNPSNYIYFRPEEARALWALAHTKNPDRAKLWVDPYGTSGMYMREECYKDEFGRVFQALEDNLTRNAVDYPTGWTEIIFGGGGG